MEQFPITRVYADPSGESRFEDISIPLTPAGTIGYLSEKHKVENIVFRKVLPGYDYDFHTAPARQYIILLDGEIEIETSLGEKRIFKGGDTLLVEDTTGKGHKTKNLLPIERSSIFITF
jgi:quercetin dioxygenase-like cupin family protein